MLDFIQDRKGKSIQSGDRLRRKNVSDIEKIQLELLQEHIKQAQKTPYYRSVLGQGFQPSSIKSLSDLQALPLTSRRDLDIRGRDFWAVKQSEVIDLALTSGTTGDPVQVPYTRRDLERLAYNETMAFYGAGVSSQDICLISVTLDRCFIAGLAYYLGIVGLGATAIRSGSGQPARQWELVNKIQPSVLVGVPSFLFQVAIWAQRHGYDPTKKGIKKIITIGEPIRRANLSMTHLGQELTDAWKSQVLSSYGATELETGICECSVGSGGHIHPELCIAEIVDEEGRVLDENTPGELVITPLGVEGLPLIRFRTGDITRKISGRCPCGWHSQRIGPIEGRYAHRLKMCGTTIYPEAIFQVLQEIPQMGEFYIEVHSNYDLSDKIRVVIGENGSINRLEIGSLLQARLRIKPEVVCDSHDNVKKTIYEQSGSKPKRFFDMRD